MREYYSYRSWSLRLLRSSWAASSQIRWFWRAAFWVCSRAGHIGRDVGRPDCGGWSGAACPGAHRRWTGCGWATACPNPSSCGPASFTGTFKQPGWATTISFHSLQFSDGFTIVKFPLVLRASQNWRSRFRRISDSWSAHFGGLLLVEGAP